MFPFSALSASVPHNTDDQTDAKILLGTYVCTDIPGEFRWVPGILSRAVIAGYWLIIEDIELASADVLSVLIPLLERRELFIPGRGEHIRAHNSFQLFATKTTIRGATRALTFSILCNISGIGDRSLLSSFWTVVRVESLSMDDIYSIMDSRFPHIAPLIRLAVPSYEIMLNFKAQVSFFSPFHQIIVRSRSRRSRLIRIHLPHFSQRILVASLFETSWSGERGVHHYFRYNYSSCSTLPAANWLTMLQNRSIFLTDLISIQWMSTSLTDFLYLYPLSFFLSCTEENFENSALKLWILTNLFDKSAIISHFMSEFW